MPRPKRRPQAGAPHPRDASEDLALVRSILLAREREHLRSLEAENEALRAEAGRLKAELDRLERRVQAEADGLIPRLAPDMSDLVGRAIRDSRDDMAEALGPVIGEAIRVKIRDSRQDMIEALYPIIGSTVQRAVAEFGRDLQRNIDARLKSTFGPEGLLRAGLARLGGVPEAQLALRDALPFELDQLFLVQHGSGLLLAHNRFADPSEADADLISAMLTVIGDFVRDSFGPAQAGAPIDEIQHGGQRIVVESGRAAYLVAVVKGVEPEGFRARLRDFVSELHVKAEARLRAYAGDPAALPNLHPGLVRLSAELAPPVDSGPRPLPRRARYLIAGGALLGVVGLAVACFYLQFTVALLPVAFPGWAPTHSQTPTASAAPAISALPSATRAAPPTATLLPPPITDRPTATTAPTATVVTPPSATPAPTQPAGFAAGNVWVRTDPSLSAERVRVLPADTPVDVLASAAQWYEVEWSDDDQIWRGWVLQRWIELAPPAGANAG